MFVVGLTVGCQVSLLVVVCAWLLLVPACRVSVISCRLLIVGVGCRSLFHCRCSVARFIVPDWGDKVNSGTGLSYRPASLCSLTGLYENPMPESTLAPQLETMNLDTALLISIS